VELAAALARRHHQASLFQHFQMLRDSLPRGCDPVLHRQPCTQLEKGLLIALRQLVENGTAEGRSDRLEDVDHVKTIGKLQLACQG